jgi:NADPH:quinone reductase-like Zn-dependent oxidoreductase
MSTSHPKTMRAVEIRAYDGRSESLALVERPVPTPGPGEVLIRIAASPINPSDLMFIRGLYGFKKPLPAVPGFEGSGTVVAAGGGLIAKLLDGRRVAFATASPRVRDGAWAEYAVTSARQTIPLRRATDLEQASMMLVNPLSAWALMEIARRGDHRAVVQTAAASALGRMVVRLGQRLQITVLNVVRREPQVQTLLAMGAEAAHIFNSSDSDFEMRLADSCRRLSVTLGFDAVAGESTMRLVAAMPMRSRVLVYGALTQEPCRVDPASLIFEGKRVEGFWVSEWLRHRTLLSQFRLTRQVQSLLATDLKSDVQARMPLGEIAEAVNRYATNMSSGKVLLVPSASA